MVWRASAIIREVNIKANRTPAPAQASLPGNPSQTPLKGPSKVCLRLTIGEGGGPVVTLPSSIILPPLAGDRFDESKKIINISSNKYDINDIENT
jgi:hypothetical protein